MKNVMKKLTGLLIVLVLALFAGCSDVDDGAKKDSSETKYTVSGRVLVGGTNGATASKLFTSASATRSATSSFATETQAGGSPMQIDALKDGEDSVTVYPAADGSYSLQLPSTGKWTLRASQWTNVDGSDSGARPSLDGSTEIEVSSSDSPISQDIIVYPSFDSGISGALNLTITDTSNKLSSVSCTAEYKTDAELSETQKAKLTGLADFVNGSATIEQTSVPVGTYDLKLSFEDENGNVLYSCKETVTVFSGWTTDTWFGESPYMQKNADGSYSFVITDALIDGYGTETVTATQTVVYDYSSSDSTYNYSTSNNETFTSSINRFVFDKNGFIYYLDEEGSSIVVKSNRTSFSTSATSRAPGCEHLIALDKNADKLWLFAEQEHSLYCYYDISSSTGFSTTADEAYVSSNSFYKNSTSTYYPTAFTANNGKLYFAGLSDGYLYITTTDVTSDIVNNSGNIELYCKDTISYDISSAASDITITDMLYQDGAVYILLRLVSSSSGIYSTGALLRYDVKFGTVKTLIRLSETVDLPDVKLYTHINGYQCYLGYDSENESFTTPFYAPADFTWQDNGEDRTIFSSLYTPSLLDNSNATLSTTGFYGPVKFVALKPRKLVIADDGLAFYTDNDVLKYKNVSRVVTVDLENFAITSSTETDAIFGENNSAMLNISFGNGSDFQEAFNSSSDVFPDLQEGETGKVYYEGKTQGVAPGDSFGVGIPCDD